MFNAQAVFKTEQEGKFTPAGFVVEVDLSYPPDYALGIDKTNELFEFIKQGKCDGFEIDLGTKKKYIIKP